MVYAPGHFQQATQQATGQPRYRSRREQIAVRGMTLIALALIGLVAYSLTSHQARSGNGCIDFNYSTMIGGAETHTCGAPARRMCATPPSRAGIDGDFQPALYAACRKAGFATGRS
jgi:hypothetical protein